MAFYFSALEVAAPPVRSVRHVDHRRDSVTLQWEPPVDYNKLKGYVIERYEEDREPPWQRMISLPHTVHRYTVPDITESRAHRFRVMTETLRGLSQPVEIETPVFEAKPTG